MFSKKSGIICGILIVQSRILNRDFAFKISDLVDDLYNAAKINGFRRCDIELPVWHILFDRLSMTFKKIS